MRPSTTSPSGASAAWSVDTLCGVGTPEGYALTHKGKLIMLPHARMALACRGDGRVLGSLYLASHCSMENLDIDSMGPTLAHAAQHIVTQIQRADPLWRFTEAELVAIGWSASRESMVAFCASRLSGESDFSLVEIPALMLAPDPGCPAPADLTRPESMQWLAGQQVARFRSLVGHAGEIGGRLLFAELRRESQRVTDLGELPQPVAPVH